MEEQAVVVWALVGRGEVGRLSDLGRCRRPTQFHERAVCQRSQVEYPVIHTRQTLTSSGLSPQSHTSGHAAAGRSYLECVRAFQATLSESPFKATLSVPGIVTPSASQLLTRLQLHDSGHSIAGDPLVFSSNCS